MQQSHAGIDVGSSLLKLAVEDAQGALHTETLDSFGAAMKRLEENAVTRVGLTGMGAALFARDLQPPHWRFGEFEAWAAGARELRAPRGAAGDFLLVSVGTGTSAIRVGQGAAVRAGGSALGGGTILGLGRLLCDTRDFESMLRLAARGDRSRVDLTIGDVYSGGDLPLPPEATAANFGKLASLGAGANPRPEDLAQAVMGLVGENLGLLCAALAGQHGVARIVFGGSTLQGNPTLVTPLRLVCLAMGRTPEFPDEGPYLGALGALARVRVVEPQRDRTTR